MTARELPFESNLATDPPVQWDDAPCHLCGRHDSQVMFEARDPIPLTGPGLVFAVVICKTCGLTYTNPRPDFESIAGFYPANYNPHKKKSKNRLVQSSSWHSKVTGRSIPERNGDLPWHGRGRLLDFGCGGGSFLRRMADRGWTVTGIDVSPVAVQTVRDEQGLRAFSGTLPHPELKPCSFDVITMWHVLEHVHEPLSTLRDAYELLVPGGKLVIALPNSESWPARWFGSSWFGLDVPRHLTHFTPQTLKEMLATAGYTLESFRLVRHSDWLRSSAKQAVKSPTQRWAYPLTKKPIAKLVAWLTYLLGKSDCMMAVAQRPMV
ncbi:MAG: class I SAM-dependent methyltransferase [Gemmataceae bacterium]